jgi:hypothetical protein
VRLTRAPAIDGRLEDWPAAAPLAAVAPAHVLTDSRAHGGRDDVSATIRFAWDDSTLYVAGDIRDDSVTAGDAWDTDRINLVFDMADDATPLTYPRGDAPRHTWLEDDYWVFWRFGGRGVRRYGRHDLDPIPGARLATVRSAAGWRFEVALPREALPGFMPAPGQTARVQVYVTDGDGDAVPTQVMWAGTWPRGTGADGLAWRFTDMGALVFVDAAIPAPGSR